MMKGQFNIKVINHLNVESISSHANHVTLVSPQIINRSIVHLASRRHEMKWSLLVVSHDVIECHTGIWRSPHIITRNNISKPEERDVHGNTNFHWIKYHEVRSTIKENIYRRSRCLPPYVQNCLSLPMSVQNLPVGLPVKLIFLRLVTYVNCHS